jgi:transketolase
VYIRVGKAALPELYPEEAPFILGKANMLADGKDLTIIACGETVAAAADAVRLLEAEGIHARLLDMHTLKPLDKDAILQAAKETGRILTVEEHHINGGLGAAVAQITAATFPVPVYTLALPDETLVAGNSKELFRHYGLDTQGIVAAAKKLMNGGV